MKKLNFIYKVRYSFSTPVTDHCYALRILPETNEEQGIYASEYQISGGNFHALTLDDRTAFSCEDTSRQRAETEIVSEPVPSQRAETGIANEPVLGQRAETETENEAVLRQRDDPEIRWTSVDFGHIVPGHDGFGNGLITGRMAEPHDRFSICVTGTAYTRRDRMRKYAPVCEPIYRYPTDLTRPGEKIRAFYAANRDAVHESGKLREDGNDARSESVKLREDGNDRVAESIKNYSAQVRGKTSGHTGEETLRRAMTWMNLVNKEISYVSGVTGIRTTAEESFAGKSGVCQDYAHVLIALLRLDGIPARYVAGLMIGEGATHAWCEAWCDGLWVELDPTHNRRVTDDYIEVAHGRDYRDCIMDRGIFRGFALQEQEVYVKVSEAEKNDVGRLGIL